MQQSRTNIGNQQFENAWLCHVVRCGSRTFVPAHAHEPTKRLYHLGLLAPFCEFGKGSVWPAFVLIHGVSVQNPRKPSPMLALCMTVQSHCDF